MKNKYFQIGMIVLLGLLSTGHLMAGTQDAAYQKYVDAYKKYQTAVSSNLPKTEIEAAAASYKDAKSAYEKFLNSDFPKQTGENSTAVTAVAITDSQPDEDATPAPGVSDSERALAGYAAALPTELKPLVEKLKQTSSKNEAIAIIATLEKHIPSYPDSITKSLLQYEVASALDRLNIDSKKAEALFTEISKSQSSKVISTWSQLALRHLKGRQNKALWNNFMNQKFSEMTGSYDKYKSGSWLAFPVKAIRGISYLSKSVSYLNSKSQHEDFLLSFEAAQAPFVANVETVFQQYQTGETDGHHDDNARIRLIYNNYDAWYVRWKVMSEARQSIDVQYFIIENDAFGLGMLGMLLKKAREGLNIRLMVDVRGSNKLSFKLMAKGYLEELAKLPNVRVKTYNPLQANLLGAITDIRRIISSNHDKILIADGRYSIIGGRNIADEYLVDPIDDPQAWRDTDVLIDSENVTTQLQKAFDEEFEILKAFEIGNSLLGMTKYRILQMEIGYAAMDAALNLRGPLKITQKFSSEAAIVNKLNKQLGGYKNMTGYSSFNLENNSRVCPVHILDSHSLAGLRNDITENIVKYIDGSRREIIIQNPYIVLTPRADAALKRAARRGVPILVHTNSPQTSDSFPTEAMLYRDWRSILRDMPTMRMFARVNEGQLHGKNFVFDRKIGIVGTYNFDFLSEKVNSEVVAVVKSAGFATELRNEIITDINKALEYTLATADKAEFGPGDVENPQKMWLIKLISKMGWLKPLF